MLFKCILKNQFISKCNIYVSQTEGLEKLFRLGQYGSKFVYIQTRLSIFNQLTAHFMFLFKCISIFKLFSSFDQVVRAEKHFKWWSLTAWMILFKSYSLLLWKLLDIVNVLQYFDITFLSSTLSNKWQNVTNYCWLSTLLWTFAIHLSYFYTYEKSIILTKRTLQKVHSTKNNTIWKTKMKQLRTYYYKRKVTSRKIIITILDAIIVLKLLNLIERYDLLITFSGVITSMESMKDVWQSS